MALLRVFLVGCLTLCLFTAIIYNFFLPKITYEIVVQKNDKSDGHQSSYGVANYADKLIDKQTDEQIDKLNYDQIDIVKDDPIVKEKHKEKKKEKTKAKDLTRDEPVINDSAKRSTSGANKTLEALNFFELGFVNNKEEERLREEGFKNYAFNLLISNRLGYKRDIPDTRHARCNSVNYTRINELPRASIIVCFYNEAKSTLFRTVQSILDRTDDRLIDEIILVNDFSDSKKATFQSL